MKYKKMMLVSGAGLISASAFLAVSLSVNENQNGNKINTIGKIYNKNTKDLYSKKEISLNDPLPYLKFSKNKEGFVKMFNVFKPYFEKFYNMSYSDKDIIKYFENNKSRALYYIEEANGAFSKRNWLSSIGNFFKGIGSGIVHAAKSIVNGISLAAVSLANGVTFGQIDALNDLVKYGAKEFVDSFGGLGDDILGFFGTSGDDIADFFVSGKFKKIENWGGIALEVSSSILGAAAGGFIGVGITKPWISALIKKGIGFVVKKITKGVAKQIDGWRKGVDIFILTKINGKKTIVKLEVKD